MEEDWLVFSTGVVPTISSAVRKLTTPNENVVIQTPVYHVFFNSILNNGCRALENRLIYRDGVYEMDFDDLERKLADPQTTLMILCNPHNPVGKIWDRKTLARIGELCEKYHVTVISDEIHWRPDRSGEGVYPFRLGLGYLQKNQRYLHGAHQDLQSGGAADLGGHGAGSLPAA